MFKRIAENLRKERGATAVEYSVLVVLIAAVIVMSVAFLGGATSSSIDCAGKSWQNKTTACSAGGSSTGSSSSTPIPTPTPTSGGNGNGNNGSGNGGVGQGNGTGNSRH